MSKSIPAILLLATLLLPTLGGYAWLRYQKSEVRQEVEVHKERGFVEEDLVRLRFSKAETQTLLRWEHAAEFEYLGQMYDIIHSEASGDSLYYWCFRDEAETRLNQQIAELHKAIFNTGPQQQEQQERLQQFYKSLYLTGSATENIPPPVTMTSTPLFYLANIQAVFFAPSTPPPRIQVVNC